MGSIAILECQLQPLTWERYLAWGLVAKGTN